MPTITRGGTGGAVSNALASGVVMLTTGRPPLYNTHNYAIDQEKLRHDDATHWYGEMTAFIMLWTVSDFEAGLVGRCSVCYTPYGEIAEVYEQPSKRRCENCLGTSFEGGYRALLYRPALWAPQVAAESIKQERGFTRTQPSEVQPTSDIELRDNDYAVRKDNTRWQVTGPHHVEIATGFGHKAGWESVVGTKLIANLEDASSVAFLVPVDLTFLATAGWNPLLPYPVAPPDIVRGPLRNLV